MEEAVGCSPPGPVGEPEAGTSTSGSEGHTEEEDGFVDAQTDPDDVSDGSNNNTVVVTDSVAHLASTVIPTTTEDSDLNNTDTSQLAI